MDEETPESACYILINIKLININQNFIPLIFVVVEVEEYIMKKLTAALLLLSLVSIHAYADEADANELPSYNVGSDWWVEVTPDDPDYHIFKLVEVNCFCN